MKLRVQDRAALASVEPVNARAYLERHGWEESDVVRGGSEVWGLAGRERYVVLPLEPTWRDFPQRMAELIRALSETENRSELSILLDLLQAGADLVRVRVEPAGVAAGSIRIDDGVRLVTQSRNLVMAAACSTVQPREQHPGRRPAKVNTYLDQVLLGQTEVGSFAVTVLSPLTQGDDGARSQPPSSESPFPRQVVRMLATGLDAARDAAEQALTTGELDVFRGAVEVGVSANLCDALVRMQDGALGGLTVGFSFAATLPAPGDVPVAVEFPADTVPILDRAADLLRLSSTQPDALVAGLVRKLERGEAVGPGRVSIAALVDDRVRPVAVDLDEDSYQAAIRAHAEGYEVSVEGDLERQGRGFVLTSPRSFTVLAE